jgi:hypothetical protein
MLAAMHTSVPSFVEMEEDGVEWLVFPGS